MEEVADLGHHTVDDIDDASHGANRSMRVMSSSSALSALHKQFGALHKPAFPG
jgi:hypothetical protein